MSEERITLAVSKIIVFVIDIGFVWALAWMFNPNVDSGMIWLLAALFTALQVHLGIIRRAVDR